MSLHFQHLLSLQEAEEDINEATLDSILEKANTTLLRNPDENTQITATDASSVASTLASPLPQAPLSPNVPFLYHQRTPRRASLVARESISLSVQALFTPTRIHSDRSFRSDSEADEKGGLPRVSVSNVDTGHLEAGEDSNAEVESRLYVALDVNSANASTSTHRNSKSKA